MVFPEALLELDADSGPEVREEAGGRDGGGGGPVGDLSGA